MLLKRQPAPWENEILQIYWLNKYLLKRCLDVDLDIFSVHCKHPNPRFLLLLLLLLLLWNQNLWVMVLHVELLVSIFPTTFQIKFWWKIEKMSKQEVGSCDRNQLRETTDNLCSYFWHIKHPHWMCWVPGLMNCHDRARSFRSES